jgi:catechol 2,3-dioxygenase-like lactoylglutathione lyase family enzyme
MQMNHITVAVTELERSIRFYERLGLQIIVHSPPRYARFYVPENDATFSLEVMPGVKPGSDAIHIYFECKNVDATYENLMAAGISFTQPPTDMRYLWREARLLDPDGYDLRLFSAGENRLNPPWRLRPGTIRTTAASEFMTDP